MKKLIKRFLVIILTIIVLVLVVANFTIQHQTNNSVYSDVKLIPANRVGLLLGTSKTLSNGKPNSYFFNRIDATVQLINARKITFVVISGDNRKQDYNEPQDMKNELIKRGLPENRIFLDYAGFRTYDSVYRINAIFGQSTFTVISQEFHNRRAIFIAKSLKLNAIGYNATDVTKYLGFKTKVREAFSRVKLFIDLIIDKKPKFLGNKIEIK